MTYEVAQFDGHSNRIIELKTFATLEEAVEYRDEHAPPDSMSGWTMAIFEVNEDGEGTHLDI